MTTVAPDVSDSEKSAISMGSQEEDVLTNQLVAEFSEAVGENVRMVRFMAQCCLRNRNYDMESARKRLGNYLAWRKETFGDLSDQSVEKDENLHAQIMTGMMYICPTRLSTGSGVLFARMRIHDPTKYNAHATIKFWHYIVLSALTLYPTLASAGFTLVNNFEGASMANLDIGVPRAISSALNKCMPIRMNSLNMVNPPWVIRMVVPMVKSIISAKLAQRLNVVLDAAELPGLLGIDQKDLPIELGGELDVDSPTGYLHELLEKNIVV